MILLKGMILWIIPFLFSIHPLDLNLLFFIITYCLYEIKVLSLYKYKIFYILKFNKIDKMKKLQTRVEKVMIVIVDWAASGMGSSDFNSPSEGLVAGKEELHELIDSLTENEKNRLVYLLKGEMITVDGWNQGDIKFLNEEFQLGIDIELNREEWEDMWVYRKLTLDDLFGETIQVESEEQEKLEDDKIKGLECLLEDRDYELYRLKDGRMYLVVSAGDENRREISKEPIQIDQVEWFILQLGIIIKGE